MGVTNLWTVVGPTARPTSLASLNRKRLAVDASIWIYQFLKAVRDKEGNALRNSHVIGFFRRICKLLYFGIKPVFVFDGGAPVLKRETVRKRRSRREGRREDAVRTAGKLLAVQMERMVEEEREKERKRKEGRRVDHEDEEEIGDEGQLVYVDEIGMGETERKKGRAEGFKRRDQYHLPDLDVRIEDMGAPDDPRIMSQAELEEYARHFHSGEDINLYDFSKIDFESPFFVSLPAGDRYNILNAARLRSRLRMGYTKDQLNGMFPDRMAFSKFQIERVKERNELTQRLMHINGGEEWQSGGRIAGEKGKEYVLVRNDGVEGGWALGVVSNKLGTTKSMAIDVDEEDDLARSEGDESDEFEDVEIEGLNRVPRSWRRKRARSVDYDYSYEDAAEKIAKKRRAVYDARKAAAQNSMTRPAADRTNDGRAGAVEEEPLFVPQDEPDEDDDLFEDVDMDLPIMEEEVDDDLQKAIAMSLAQPTDDPANAVTAPQQVSNSDEDDNFDMGAALAESRRAKQKINTEARKVPPAAAAPAQPAKFGGPLPFESLNLGQSLLGKKKAKKVEENLSGGFDRDLGEDAFRKERPPQPMPSWFGAAAKTQDMKSGLDISEEVAAEDGEDHVTLTRDDRSRRELLHRHQTGEVIDLEADSSTHPKPSQIELSSDDSDDDKESAQEALPDPDEWQLPEQEVATENIRAERERKAEEEAREARYDMAREIAGERDEPNVIASTSAVQHTEDSDVLLQPEGKEVPSMDEVAERVKENPPTTSQPTFIPSPQNEPTNLAAEADDNKDEDTVEWSDSQPNSPAPAAPEEDEEDEEFEDVPMNDLQPPNLVHQPSTGEVLPAPLNADQYLLPDEHDQPSGTGDASGNDPSSTTNPAIPEDDFSDSDEEMMRQLAIEVEEHARFANSLTNPHKPTKNSSDPNAHPALRDFEAELKQLRNNQKSNLRDADEVTSTMISECQSLLSLFGLPYITAPMEAEAQCAELVHLGLVDGIVTDDSDIFLFGGTRIYKNMFNAAKFVECYLASDLEKEYTLTRTKLIQFAHLLGSDYTEGIPGIGPVSALEILTDFADLDAFSTWVNDIQAAATRPNQPSLLDDLLTTPFRRKFKPTAQKRLFLPTQFPDKRVDYAYLQPEVDSSPEAFQWGVPDLDKLRSFLMATIGWSQERTDEVLVPVIRDMNKREKEGTQANITRFFDGAIGVGGDTRRVVSKNGNAAVGADANGNGDAAAVLGQRNRTGAESGRMKNAFKRLRGEAERRRRGELDEDGTGSAHEDAAQNDNESALLQGIDSGIDETANVVSMSRPAGKAPSKAKRTRKTKKVGSTTTSNDDNEDENDHMGNDEAADDESESYQPRRKRTQAGKGRGRGGKAAAA